MEIGGVTWVVVADAERARVFLERSRGGELVELEAEALRREAGERPHGHRHLSTVHESSGSSRHGAGERDLDQEAAKRFFRRVAQRLEARMEARAFDTLAIIAPPRALGALKAELDGKLSARLAATEPHEGVGETVEQIRSRLRHARAASSSR